MLKKVFSLIVLMVLLFGINSYAQYSYHSFGPAPTPSVQLPPSISNDNLLNASNRGFVHISGTSSHQWNKQFMGNVSVTPIGSPFTTAGWIGATTRNTTTGVFYVNNQASPFQIWSLDTNTGAATVVVSSCTGIPHANFTGMVWDHTTNTMYGLSSDLSTSAIFTINMSTGVCTPVGSSSATCAGGIGLYCAPNGSLFANDIVGNNLYKFNKSTGAPTLVGPLNYDANYGQDGAFDLSDGMLYLGSAGPGNILRVCDTTTGSATTVIGTYAGQPSTLTVIGNMGPSVTHTPLPNTQNLTGPYVVNAVVSPQGSAIASAKIFWSRNNVNLTDSVTMTNSSGNNWTGNIPGNGTTATYRYRIKALDGLGRAGYHPGPSTVNQFNAFATDTTKPVITHTPIGPTPKAVWPISCSANVTDNIGVDSVWVRWYKSSAPSVVKQFKLLYTTGSTYTAQFNSTNPEVSVGDVINYRIIAQDASAQHLKDSTALYNFTIINEVTVCIGNGTVQMGTSASPYNTYWYGARTQILFTAAEILAAGGAAGGIKKIGFQVATVGGQPMNGLTFRLQNSTLTSLSAFVSTGWTQAWTGNYTVPGTGWQYVEFTSPYFNWNGTDNLLVEVCFGNTSYTTATVVNGTASTNMYRTEYHDLSTACAYTGFTAGTNQTSRANTCFVIIPPQGVTPINSNVPNTYSLSQNYPNPFNPVTKINFAIPKQGFVNLRIYDILGREVRTLVNEVKAPGYYAVDFNASELSTGVYFYRLESNGFTDIKKMMLIK